MRYIRHYKYYGIQVTKAQLHSYYMVLATEIYIYLFIINNIIQMIFYQIYS